MALQTFGLLGPVTNKIGNVVGAKWKNRYYFRTLVTPSDPQTAAQLQQRGIFATLVAIARPMVLEVIRPFWNPFFGGMSGFNAFIKYNMQLQGETFDWSRVITARGNLEGAEILFARYSDPALHLDYTAAPSGNGLETDLSIVVIHNKNTHVSWFYNDAQRGDEGQYEISPIPNQSPDDLVVYLAFYRYEGNRLVVSNSSYAQVTAL